VWEFLGLRILLAENSMNSALINQQDFTTALEADSYGHPKKAEARRLHIQPAREWVWTPKADRFGHVKELIPAAIVVFR
jgi:hypothetical protein